MAICWSVANLLFPLAAMLCVSFGTEVSTMTGSWRTVSPQDDGFPSLFRDDVKDTTPAFR